MKGPVDASAIFRTEYEMKVVLRMALGGAAQKDNQTVMQIDK
jgi:hypothetical protein